MGRDESNGIDRGRYSKWIEVTRLGQEPGLIDRGEMGGHRSRLRRSTERYSQHAKNRLCDEEWSYLQTVTLYGRPSVGAPGVGGGQIVKDYSLSAPSGDGGGAPTEGRPYSFFCAE